MDDTIASPRPSRRLRTLGGLAAAGIGITLGAAGISAAATNPSPSPSTGSTAQAPALGGPDGMGGPGGMGRHHGPRGGDLLHGALHGQLVVPNGTTGYRTVLIQRGKASGVSATSITVTSKDGYVHTYALTAATKVDVGRGKTGTVSNGDAVGLVATETGDVLGVRDLTKIQADRAARGDQAPPAGAPTGLDDPADAQGA